MKKKKYVIALGMIMSLLLVACGEKKNNKNQDTDSNILVESGTENTKKNDEKENDDLKKDNVGTEKALIDSTDNVQDEKQDETSKNNEKTEVDTIEEGDTTAEEDTTAEKDTTVDVESFTFDNNIETEGDTEKDGSEWENEKQYRAEDIVNELSGNTYIDRNKTIYKFESGQTSSTDPAGGRISITSEDGVDLVANWDVIEDETGVTILLSTDIGQRKVRLINVDETTHSVSVIDDMNKEICLNIYNRK